MATIIDIEASNRGVYDDKNGRIRNKYKKNE